jgi:WD40 repeat protein
MLSLPAHAQGAKQVHLQPRLAASEAAHPGNRNSPQAMAASADGQQLVIGGDDGRLHVFDVSKQQLQFSQSLPDSRAMSVTFAPVTAGGLPILAVGDDCGQVHVLAASNPVYTCLHVLQAQGDTSAVVAVDFARGGNVLIVCNAEGHLALWCDTRFVYSADLGVS